jgi:hypothetical protein
MDPKGRLVGALPGRFLIWGRFPVETCLLTVSVCSVEVPVAEDREAMSLRTKVGTLLLSLVQ